MAKKTKFFPSNGFKALISATRDIIRINVRPDTIRECKIRYSGDVVDAKLAIGELAIVDDNDELMKIEVIIITPPDKDPTRAHELLDEPFIIARLEMFEDDMEGWQLDAG